MVMIMRFWIREVYLKAGNKEFTGDKFEIDFRVPFSTNKEPDISEVMIYNLSQNSIASIGAKAYVILNAGYKGDTGNILTGKIESIFTAWEGMDKVTTIKASDGGIDLREARVSRTYQAGTLASFIMGDLAGILGLEIGEISPKTDIEYRLGKSVSGSVKMALEQLVKETSSKMYVHKGRLYIRDDKKGTETGFLLNSGTGLIGSPEKIEEEKNGQKAIKYGVRALLNHKIGTDSIIKVQSRTINGLYRVESGVHTGDFITEMTVVPI